MSNQGSRRPPPVHRYGRRPYRNPEESIETPAENYPSEESPSNSRQDEVRLVLLGKTGAGKSASGNTILGEERFDSKVSMGSVTKVCKRERGTVDGRNLLLVDTPGLFDTDLKEEQIQHELIHCLTLCSPGPHVFLLVIPIERYTQEQQRTVEMIREMFKHDITNRVIIVFSHGDRLEETSIDEFLSQQNQKVQELVEMFGKRYVAFNNKDPANRDQVSGLLEKVDELLLQYENKPFSNEMTEIVLKAQTIIDERRIMKIKEDVQKEADQRRAAFTAHMKEDREDSEKIKKRVRVRIDLIEADIKKEKENVNPITERLKRMQVSLEMEQMNLRRLERVKRERVKREQNEKRNIDLWMCEEQQRRASQQLDDTNMSDFSYIQYVTMLSSFLSGIFGSFASVLLSYLFPAAPALAAGSALAGGSSTQMLEQMLNVKNEAFISPTALNIATMTQCTIQ